MTDITICNRALQKLGAGTITALSDGTRLGDACGLVYAELRDSVLAGANWNFALKRAVLTVLGTSPAWGYTKEYTIPADSLRVAKVDRLVVDEWSAEDGKILCDQDTSINIIYIYQNTTTTSYSPMFVEALTARIAWELAEYLVQSRTKKEDLRNEYLQIMQEARRINGIEGTPNALDNGSWLDSRV